MNKKNVLFDFDGVIIDSFDAAFVVQQILHPTMTADQYRKLFEGNIYNWDESVAKSIHSDACRHDIDFFDEYLPKIMQLQVFPGILDAIDTLHRQYRLTVVSSTISAPIREYLESHNMTNHFDDILGSDVHTSKVEKIQLVLQKHQANPKDCIFITDTLGDMREAEKMQVAAIGVSWGFHSHQTLGQGKPFRIVDAPQELPAAVAEYFNQTA